MGWFSDWFRSVKGAPPTDLTYLANVTGSDLPGLGDPIEPDMCYIELYVESLRIEKARKFATTFNGAVYSFVSLPREADSAASFAAVSKPAKLSGIDPKAAGSVITVSKQMMGPVAWRGGPLRLEIGLFSIKTGNLLTPVLDYVASVSTIAGVSFVGAVKPFLPLITQGMEMLAGQRDDTQLEVGIDTDLGLNKSVMMAIIDAPKGTYDGVALQLDPSDRKLLVNGKPLEAAYCVFSIRRTLQKNDFGEIPELKERYAAIQAAIKANKPTDAKDALVAFRLTTLASPDLIRADAVRLVEKVEQKVKDAFPAGGISSEKSRPDPGPLSQIPLY
ncbi:hypothetical protein DSM104443_03191 [Usitatibacter rugosus]|uniref:Uncharacterized protein n=1 Tax=Usitatibacter rugosus TaxID=2732067 RepID=A0A6M4H2Q9_9PROT|nr:hypothetical protein [Usitatibacter rugosus]QJR12107.1 hypothetical protein DSM104443_03191 [Usitatibacter rugosus]